MQNPIPWNRRHYAISLALLLAAATLPLAAGTSLATQDDMEGMGAAPVQPKPAPMSMAMSKPAKPAKPAAMPMAAAPAPAQPMAGMTPAPAKAEPAAPMGSMGSMGSTAMPPAAAMTAPMPSGETMAMEEPKPSSLNGGLILALFAALNIGVIAVAAVLKPRRKNPTASSEVKA